MADADLTLVVVDISGPLEAEEIPNRIFSTFRIGT
jgi:hypothetical protein